MNKNSIYGLDAPIPYTIFVPLLLKKQQKDQEDIIV